MLDMTIVLKLLPTLLCLSTSDKVILVQQNKTWVEALNYCRENHQDLVSITNLDEERWVQERAKNANSPFVWLGLHYSWTLESWFWVSDKEFCYNNWASSVTDDCDKSAAMERGGQNHKSLWFWFLLRSVILVIRGRSSLSFSSTYCELMRIFSSFCSDQTCLGGTDDVVCEELFPGVSQSSITDLQTEESNMIQDDNMTRATNIFKEAIISLQYGSSSHPNRDPDLKWC
ncbi:hypothetical protein Q8A73_013088 [Channa argus]|nr:hypothetical protein Q8A73_013088 [Channa argus]